MSRPPVTAARLAIATVGVLLLCSLTGCAFKASEQECKLACENVAAISNEEVNVQVEKDEALAETGEGGKNMARNMAEAMVDAIRDECAKQCAEKGTRKQAECLAKLTSVAELESCM
jgi:hypothetical protein